jgi:hypothetical protein
MRVAKEQVDVKLDIPGATIRQRKDFGDASGLGNDQRRVLLPRRGR